MYWRLIPGVVHIVVHTDEPPSDADWDACIDDVSEHGEGIKGVLVYSTRTGPSASQRTKANAVYEKFGGMKMAIMASSRLVIGIVTAISWAVGNDVKAFATTDFEGAANYVGLNSEERLKARVVLRQLARSAGRDIDAFSDESGRFRKKLS